MQTQTPQAAHLTLEGLPKSHLGGTYLQRQTCRRAIARIQRLIAEADDRLIGYGMRTVSTSSLMGLAASAATAVGVARALAVPVVLVQASVWKKELGVTSDKVTSIARAIELHGECKYLSNRSRNKAGTVRPDHNHAEAQLLACYGLLHIARKMRATGTRSLR